MLEDFMADGDTCFGMLQFFSSSTGNAVALLCD
jgi:hypothetical protein